MSFNLLIEGMEISKEWIVKSLNIYFGEFWEEGFSVDELVLKLEIKQFTKDELQEFAELFREVFLKLFNLEFDRLIISLRSSVFFYSIFGSLEIKKIFSRLENIFLATASDQDLDSLVSLFKKEKSYYSWELTELKEKRKKLISKTRKKSIFPKRRKVLDDDPVWQVFLASLDFSDQEVN